MSSTVAIDPSATATSDISTTAVKDAPLLSTALGGQASSSTLPASHTIASNITTTDEKSSTLPLASTRQDASETDMSQNEDPQSIDQVTLHPAPASPRPKSLSITLLLISGARYPITINPEYMSRHNITVTDQDPMLMDVSALKECIWKEWKVEEWNVKPPSANYIRLIHFGRLLDDRQQLKDCRLNPDAPNVVHMTVRPAETGDDDATQRSTKLGFSGRDREGRERSSPTCRCVIL